MTSVKPHGSLPIGTVAVRRKPTLTHQSPAQSSALWLPEQLLCTSQNATTSSQLPSTPPQLPRISAVSERSTFAHDPTHHCMTTPLLPLYHPFGSLALSLPDLDPSAFGLPAPVAVFDDPTRRSHRQRRPAAKVRDVEDHGATLLPPSFVAVTPTLESEVREKSSPRRRRGGGPAGKRRRRELEDGDATYPAKRPRNPRHSEQGPGRALNREEGSPALSNSHLGASPALDSGRGDVVEEKRAGRRTTRSRGAIARRDSTASEETTTSTTPSGSVTNVAVPRVALSGEPLETEEPETNNILNEASESNKGDLDDIPVSEQQEK